MILCGIGESFTMRAIAQELLKSNNIIGTLFVMALTGKAAFDEGIGAGAV